MGTSMLGSSGKAVPMDPDKRFLVRVPDEVEMQQVLLRARISSFTGDFEFLLTTTKSRVVIPGEHFTEDSFQPFPTVEHAFQAAKSCDADYRSNILACKTAIEAKRIGAKTQIDKDAWKQKSLIIMEALLRDKFRRHKALRTQLLATAPKSLVHENDYNDQYWGISKGKGQNHLGNLLEKIRADEQEGLLAILLWTKAIYQPMSDKKVCVEMTVTKDGANIADRPTVFEKRSIITFGKLTENDVAINHPSGSRLHALLVVTEEHGTLLVDLEAPNGTFMDGRRLEPLKGAKLGPQNVIHFGTSARRYTFVVDTAFDAKRESRLYSILDDPSKLAAEQSELTVFVGNLPSTATEELIKSFFTDCGIVLEVVLPRHKQTKELRGFALVMFGTEAAVLQALKLDRDPFHGGPEIRIRRHQPKPRDGQGQGGGSSSLQGSIKRPFGPDHSQEGNVGQARQQNGREPERVQAVRSERVDSRARKRSFSPEPRRNRSRSRERRTRERGDKDRDARRERSRSPRRWRRSRSRSR